MQASMKCFCFSVLGSFCVSFGFGVNSVCLSCIWASFM